MSRLATRLVSQLEAASFDALADVQIGGKVPDVYLQFANSEPALRAYLHMEASVRNGSLSAAEVEAVKLWVSEQTGCEFCLSVHSFKALKAGLSVPQQLDIRLHSRITDSATDDISDDARPAEPPERASRISSSGEPRKSTLTAKSIARINSLLALASLVYRTRGSVTQAALDEARSAGLSDENLVDLTMAISTIFFTNITNHLNDTQSSLPPAPALG